jgi:mRNA-degrading endonuclease toxin of MazEF toxin-antitoxin module
VSNSAPTGWFPRRDEMCLVRLDRDRPALVISTDALNRHALDICVVPVTSMNIDGSRFGSHFDQARAG